jgi:hypothetical protein
MDGPSSVLHFPFVVLIHFNASANEEDGVDDFQERHEGDNGLDELNHEN